MPNRIVKAFTKAKDGIQGAGSFAVEFLDDITATHIKDAHYGKRWYSGPRASAGAATSINASQKASPKDDDWVMVDRDTARQGSGTPKRSAIDTAARRKSLSVIGHNNPKAVSVRTRARRSSSTANAKEAAAIASKPLTHRPARPILRAAPDHDSMEQQVENRNVRFDLPARRKIGGGRRAGTNENA